MKITKTFSAFCDEYSLSIPMITEKALRGTKIGKILRKELIKGYNTPDMELSLNSAVQTGVCCWNAGLHVERLQISDRYEDFILAYNNETIHSCMTNEAEKFAQFYIANNVRIAFLMLDGKVTARTLVSGKLHSDLYGVQIEELAVALRELDYMDASCTIEKFMPDELVLPRHEDGNFYLPYIDTLGGKMFIEEWRTTNAIGLKYLDVYNPFDDDIIEYEGCDLVMWDYEMQKLDGSRMIILPNKEQQIIPHETFQQVQYTLLPVHQMLVSEFQARYAVLMEREAEGLARWEENNIEPEVIVYWNQLRINGRLFWCHHYWEKGLSWDYEVMFMDDYGDVEHMKDSMGSITDVHDEIELGVFGRF